MHLLNKKKGQEITRFEGVNPVQQFCLIAVYAEL
jgi:hypothetical protein